MSFGQGKEFLILHKGLRLFDTDGKEAGSKGVNGVIHYRYLLINLSDSPPALTHSSFL